MIELLVAENSMDTSSDHTGYIRSKLTNFKAMNIDLDYFMPEIKCFNHQAMLVSSLGKTMIKGFNY